MSEPEAPKIEFPCEDYPIKIMGQSGPVYHEFVVSVVERHAPGFDQTRITVRESAKGTFQSITVFITATGVNQLQALHQELTASDMTKMVL
ncbi:DUF493 domain-containing protein [Maricurvus nonylphenolicus]|uniref:YbeD family protein n=1 Tax=Maricurvus nonylphenolicus TaxID=1008307 RepID=UPI0036F20ED6